MSTSNDRPHNSESKDVGEIEKGDSVLARDDHGLGCTIQGEVLSVEGEKLEVAVHEVFTLGGKATIQSGPRAAMKGKNVTLPKSAVIRVNRPS